MAHDAIQCDRVRVVSGRELMPEDWAAWSSCQSENPALASPFFRPEYTQIIAAVRDDVRVAILEGADRSRGFFPFQMDTGRCGIPVGGFLSDYQGVIAESGFRWAAPGLMRASGLRSWRFDHVPDSQAAFRLYRRAVTQSPVMDLAEGYARYVEDRRKAGSEQIKKALGLRRKLERERGPIEVDIQSADAGLLRLLMDWKSRQYIESGKTDLFALSWVVAVLERIFAQRSAAFAGMLSVLRVGGQPVALHFGLRSQTVWHYWLPTYDPEFAHFSPGILLLLAMAERAAEFGMVRIDLGVGRAQYKQRLMNAATPIIEGEVPASRLKAAVVSGSRLLLDSLRRSRPPQHP